MSNVYTAARKEQKIRLRRIFVFAGYVVLSFTFLVIMFYNTIMVNKDEDEYIKSRCYLYTTLKTAVHARTECIKC